jgi:nucleoside 2-deoxyribosyltransferase
LKRVFTLKKAVTKRADKAAVKIYLAGPLFTIAEKNFNATLARFLEDHGFDVWLPQEHEPRRNTARAIFQLDVEAIDLADVVVACMDGPDPDSGTSWECGYAFAKRKPIVCYRTDFRISGDAKGVPYNLMLSESATSRFEVSLKTKPDEFRQKLLGHIRKALKARRAG